MAGWFGKDADAARYAGYAESFRSAWCAAFLREDGTTVCGTQTSYALALAFGIIPEDLRAASAAHLAMNIADHGWKLTTGDGEPVSVHSLRVADAVPSRIPHKMDVRQFFAQYVMALNDCQLDIENFGKAEFYRLPRLTRERERCHAGQILPEIIDVGLISDLTDRNRLHAVHDLDIACKLGNNRIRMCIFSAGMPRGRHGIRH